MQARDVLSDAVKRKQYDAELSGAAHAEREQHGRPGQSRRSTQEEPFSEYTGRRQPCTRKSEHSPACVCMPCKVCPRWHHVHIINRPRNAAFTCASCQKCVKSPDILFAFVCEIYICMSHVGCHDFCLFRLSFVRLCDLIAGRILANTDSSGRSQQALASLDQRRQVFVLINCLARISWKCSALRGAACTVHSIHITRSKCNSYI